MSDTTSQNEALLRLLRRAGPEGVTALEALREVGTLRLASRVFDLRAAGHEVQTEMIRLEGGKRVARYTLREQAQLGLSL